MSETNQEAGDHAAATPLVQVTVIPNGPLRLRGPMAITRAPGSEAERCDELFLCRCGASGTKPYCDGTHKKIGFKSD